MGEILPASLTGTVSATALQAIADYHLQGRPERIGDRQALLAALYNQQEDVLTAVAQQTFAAMDVLSKIETEGYVANGRAYPEREFGKALQTVAQLIKADVGLEVACVDLVGWDTHVAQGSARALCPRSWRSWPQAWPRFMKIYRR
ncbi:MAG: hypothetical protein M5U34_07920 [Chloroflexi bacterium]|nr:hypothetical protein [Chloroflexota bacterium]